MSSEPIDATEFAQRLEALCIGGSSGLPKRPRDRAILLASATLWMAPDSVYTEVEVNTGLQQWLDTGCPSLTIDVVTLRRELVDRVYINRDDSGRHYSPGPGPRDVQFDPSVGSIDPGEVIQSAMARRRDRKARHQTNAEET